MIKKLKLTAMVVIVVSVTACTGNMLSLKSKSHSYSTLESINEHIKYGNWDAAYRFLEDIPLDNIETALNIISEHPIIVNAGVNTFSPGSLKKSKKKYGEKESFTIERDRLFIIERYISKDELNKIKKNFISEYSVDPYEINPVKANRIHSKKKHIKKISSAAIESLSAPPLAPNVMPPAPPAPSLLVPPVIEANGNMPTNLANNNLIKENVSFDVNYFSVYSDENCKKILQFVNFDTVDYGIFSLDEVKCSRGDVKPIKLTYYATIRVTNKSEEIIANHFKNVEVQDKFSKKLCLNEGMRLVMKFSDYAFKFRIGKFSTEFMGNINQCGQDNAVAKDAGNKKVWRLIDEKRNSDIYVDYNTIRQYSENEFSIEMLKSPDRSNTIKSQSSKSLIIMDCNDNAYRITNLVQYSQPMAKGDVLHRSPTSEITAPFKFDKMSILGALQTVACSRLSFL